VSGPWVSGAGVRQVALSVVVTVMLSKITRGCSAVSKSRDRGRSAG
jgi:hypothetical protein